MCVCVCVYICNMLCAFSWNKKKKLTARRHGVESFKIKYVKFVVYILRSVVLN